MEAMTSLFGPDSDEILQECLPPEVEEGKFEYKLKLIDPSHDRFEHLVTQMKWRLQEGNGEAVYEIGVADNGMLAGLSHEDLTASLSTLRQMAEKLGAVMSVVRERFVDPDKHERKVAEVLVRKVPDDQQFIDLRMAVLGNVDSGKSTLLGVLTHGELDNGQGQARLNLFRHLHEIQSGRTSSISHEILGFNSYGEVINYSESRTAEEICEKSSKLITLIDLAGHHKYLKTTIFGLTGHSPDFAMLVISANTGIAGTSKEHLGFALALGVPVFVVINKIDMVHPAVMERAVRQLERILASPGCNKVPYRVRNEDDAVNAATNFKKVESITPIFLVSCVNGENLDLITKFLNVLPPMKSVHEREKLAQQLVEFQVDEVYSVPGVGTVAGGMLVNGIIKENDVLLAGPGENGEFLPITIHSLQRNRLPCRSVHAGQAASVAAVKQSTPVNMRKGMVLLSPKLIPESCLCFEAKIYVLYHSRSISKGFQTTVHIGNVVQTAFIKEMDQRSVSTNQKAVVTFCFIKQPEYIHVGSRLLFREGKTKGMGEVTRIFPL